MKRKALKAAFPHTIPIMTGFMFLGMAYGIYMNASGFSFIFTGSLLQLSVASSVLYSPLIQKASALS